MKIPTYRPTYAEIDLSAIRHNFLQFRKLAGSSVKILVAVKANAYGHGMLGVCRALEACGVDYFGVGSIDEAIELKKFNLGVPILNLTAITEKEIPALLDSRIIQTVPGLKLAKAINRVAEKKKTKVKIHLKIDTGMGRLGVWHSEAVHFAEEVLGMKHLAVEGIFTHFASADDNIDFTGEQIENFINLLNELEQKGVYIKYKHTANSAGAVTCKDAHFNIIRPGIMIYGLYPNMELKKTITLRPALTLKSKICYIKDTPSGRQISYGGTYITKRNTKIAVLPIGYADGYNRLLSNKGSVLVRGQRAPIVGRVCMDQIMVDVGHIKDAAVDDEVVLIGAKGKERITAEEIAFICGTIPYEVVCWISSRVPRVYKGAKK
ncbi:MAG: alanine racemase [Candidatus Omnitrophota bacterium]